ncbi:serine protein kinase, putative [Talaromyces islandicus]|uniref:non-specific serine/threonine protein kinase n=1 Tax=Talaromyces islandicus TaxID=28573 RepID=A0A0U1M3C9_TALIS|nr:serine protein kinase, putative [Talaromyces islandicus]
MGDYRPGGYHLVLLGNIFNNGQYKVIRKLGEGSYSTVWLGRGLKSRRYVALKILVSKISGSTTELQVLRHSTGVAPRISRECWIPKDVLRQEEDLQARLISPPVQRLAGKEDIWAPQYLCVAQPLVPFTCYAEGLKVKLSDMGGGKYPPFRLSVLFLPNIYTYAFQPDDLLENNIHVDETTGHITGIVDWSAAIIAPFGVSLGGLYSAFKI